MEAAWALELLGREGWGTAQVGQGKGSGIYPASDRNNEHLIKFQGRDSA